ncbi:4-(cytidine 5'-diphospho)-2-C-methyl-D-erythritol kinase [Natronoglycomyces albus]|uniref:4-diphosphocytidyl-2-C-methyl-D-erythritol kinase n=1 Tax=Natronoglycomyces albus TaxID=2811108 RepID=A0A895XP25_9ACTN|nr:4-(cytidine 5'-diphospho)-2-C-methyl-D-erythritol kinase [Natronoglycomyces albus]QSB05512.1 4-(cytidine 5'-diphospho)-2-C-methyl-D-erythritol kinase [Natronoglycomyces albus]
MSEALARHSRPTGTVRVTVPAKINLHLGVGDLRADGFHDLTTVYQAISLYDTVTVSTSDRSGLRITVTGEGADQVPTDERNLALKAAKLLGIYGHISPAAVIHLDKRIPVAGGLAGGSADAAATLVACAQLWNLRLSDIELEKLAAGLGSDVPFCLRGGIALGTGRGEELNHDLKAAATYHWVVATSQAHISTPECYREVDRLRANDIGRYSYHVQPLLKALEAGLPAEEIAPLLVNDMEAAAVSLRPELSSLMHAGLDAGALAAHVSGSGPTVLFLARDEAHARSLAKSPKLRASAKALHVAHGPVAGPAEQLTGSR